MMNNHVPHLRTRRARLWAIGACLLLWNGAGAAEATRLVGAESLPDTVARVKASIVGVGTYQRTGRPPARLLGTGFVVADGRHVFTNAHVVPTLPDEREQASLVVFVGSGADPEMRLATRVAEDLDHDVMLLKIAEAPLPTLTLGDSDKVREGETYAFTGFPLGAILGLYPATHHGLLAAITPIVAPLDAANQLTPALMRRLRANYDMFQLDATAYPGNSGSPLYDPATGVVIGIVNKVFVQETKESVLQKPSGISYAIPINHARELLRRAGLSEERR